MAEKKKAANKKTTTTKKAPAKKAETKKAETKKVEVKKEVAKTEVKKEKKEAKLKKWFYSLTLEKIIAYCTLVIVLLLIVLIVVATKNTKTKNGDDIVVKINGMTVTANELYTALKKQAGQTTAINMIDEYILDKEYKTTSDMKESAKETLNTYKTQYGDQFEAFLEYNGIKDEKELKELLIKNKKLTLATDDYIKNSLTEKEMKKYYEEKIKGDISAKHILVAFNYEDDATDEEKEKIEKSAKKKAEEASAQRIELFEKNTRSALPLEKQRYLDLRMWIIHLSQFSIQLMVYLTFKNFRCKLQKVIMCQSLL